MEEYSKNDITLKELRKCIKDYSLKLEDITKIYTISEQKLVAYFKAEKDYDTMNIDKLSIATSSQLIDDSQEELSLRPQTEKKNRKNNC